MKKIILPLLSSFLSCGFVPLPLEKVANTSRTDAQAADGKGGWLDLGSHDLHVLPMGEAQYASVPFLILPTGDETAKNCLILGRRGADSAVLALPESQAPQTPQILYLLHANADGPAAETHQAIGRILLRYEDGTVSEQTIRVGDNVAEWTSGRGFANAVRAWTAYNHNTQVSLFVSLFALKPLTKLAEVGFEANGTCPWMILAATVTEKVKLHPIRGSVEPTGEYKSPAPPAKPLLRAPPGQKPKNVILVIGDGMGLGAQQLASYYKHGRADGLYFQRFPVFGLCSTFSASAPVTDSAASATAFATGTKTSNGVLGLQVDAQYGRTNAVRLVSVAERARAKGLGVAVMTSEPLTGATPSAFFAHAISRGSEELICAQAADSGFDVLMGNGATEAWFRPAGAGGKRKDGRDLVRELTQKGYALVHTPGEIAAAPKGLRILGSLVSLGSEEAIGEAMTAVFGRLGARPDGFFMMAECADTDHACHGNDSSDAVKTVSMVEFMAKAAIDFAQTRGDTLVIVTADHDTGHPSVLREPGPNGRLVIQWTDTSHTKFPVPLYAYGPGAELFEGILDNTDIAKKIIHLLKLSE